jgi:hypothetical protein
MVFTELKLKGPFAIDVEKGMTSMDALVLLEDLSVSPRRLGLPRSPNR